jgi:hypothetical protein
MSVVLTILIGICVLVVFLLINIIIIPIVSGNTSKEENDGCFIVLFIFIVIIAILYGLRACIS